MLKKNYIRGFLNCYATYIANIISYMTKEEKYKNSYVFYIKDRILIEKWKDNLKKYIDVNDNPWKYKPFICGNKEIDLPNKFSEIDSLCKYIYRTYNIKTWKYNSATRS